MSATPTARGTVEVLADAAAVARAGAERFVAGARYAISENGRFTVAVAGGSTPKAMNQLLASEYRDQVEWGKVVVLFGDERTVPPDHADSNYRMTKESLLDKVPIAAENVHRIRGEAPPEEAAREYAATLTRLLGQKPGVRFPAIDLVFLGMGPDGHTASLFPGSSAVAEREALVVSTFVEKLSTHRITLTAPELSAASELIVQAAGAEKAANLKVALEGPVGAVPISLVQPPAERMTWLVDRAAAAQLACVVI